MLVLVRSNTPQHSSFRTSLLAIPTIALEELFIEFIRVRKVKPTRNQPAGICFCNLLIERFRQDGQFAKATKFLTMHSSLFESFMPMDVYSIEEMYGRRLGAYIIPVVRVKTTTVWVSGASPSERVFRLEFGLRNIGRCIARFPFIMVANIFGATKGQGVLPGLDLPTDLPLSPVGNGRFIGGSDHVVHPGLEIYGPAYDAKFQVEGDVLKLNTSLIEVNFTFGCEGQLARTSVLHWDVDQIIEVYGSLQGGSSHKTLVIENSTLLIP